MAKKSEQRQETQYCNKFNKDIKHEPHKKKKRPVGTLIATMNKGKYA